VSLERGEAGEKLPLKMAFKTAQGKDAKVSSPTTNKIQKHKELGTPENIPSKERKETEIKDKI